MAKRSNVLHEQKQIERLQQQLLILESKLTILLQVKETIISKLAALRK